MLVKRTLGVSFLLGAVTFSVAAPACAEIIGVVLMHGKQGAPDAVINYLATRIEAAGFPVDRPTMCWSRTRIYDRAFLDCFADIDSSIERLKSRGATSIVVAGQSLGGAAALAYGARHEGLKGIIALAPAPGPSVARRQEVATSLDKARVLIAQGRGDESVAFLDINLGKPFAVHTTPNIFVSFLAADGPAAIPANATRLKAPLLWVAGRSDPSQPGPDYAFDKAPPNPLNRYVTVNANHLGTPNAAGDAVLSWLKDLSK